MIHAKDLRIGNWVHFECENLHMTTRGTVNYIRQDGVYVGGDSVGAPIYMIGLTDQWGQQREEHIIDLEEINLTPEIITKCDFAKCYESTWLITFVKSDNTAFEVEFLKQSKIKVLFKGEKLRDIEYVHQLQNASYCLFGEELNIQL